MTILKILLVLVLYAGGYKYYDKQLAANELAQAKAIEAGSDAGFVRLPPADGHSLATVFVVAPLRCTREEARRAEQLTAGLSRAGVSVQRTNQVSWSGFDPSYAENIKSVMDGELPIVFVGGRAKNNPSLGDALAAARNSGL